MPSEALANGLWIGDIPPELQNLTWMEQRLIAKVIYNYCIVRVFTGAQKMRANAISHAIPMPKVYDILPPAKSECEELLACLYISPYAPKDSEYKRTPFVIRRNKVRAALEWLKLNHQDYANIEISEENLAQYEENKIPVEVIYQKSDQSSNKDPEATAVNDNEEEEGTSEGQCPFVMNTLTVDEYNALLDPTKPFASTRDIIIARAISYFKRKGKVLGIGHAEEPESIYNNPQLYPQMFPWLFPYGMGGIRNVNSFTPVSEAKRKEQLLMYHD